MKRLNPDRLHVDNRCDPPPREHITPRRYTLTHSDRTGDLYLTIDADYDRQQISGWYTRIMRDEVLAEWTAQENGFGLHVHCHVSGGFILGPEAWREGIFRRELPLVLEALRYGDQGLYLAHPDLEHSPIQVHFHYARADLDRVESWGILSDYE